MKERVYSIYASIISIIGFLLQLTQSSKGIKTFLLFASVISLVILVVVTLFNSDVVKRKKLIIRGNKVILSTRERAVLFGGDLSWTDDYLESIRTICNENKEVEIWLPKSKYENSNNGEILNRINRLKGAGAKVFSYGIDFGLRCILIDPNSYKTNDYMEIMITDRIYRHRVNSLKNKYSLKHLRYRNITQKNICRSYIANYYNVKNDYNIC